MEDLVCVRVVRTGNVKKFAEGDYIVGTSGRLRLLLKDSDE